MYRYTITPSLKTSNFFSGSPYPTKGISIRLRRSPSGWLVISPETRRLKAWIRPVKGLSAPAEHDAEKSILGLEEPRSPLTSPHFTLQSKHYRSLILHTGSVPKAHAPEKTTRCLLCQSMAGAEPYHNVEASAARTETSTGKLPDQLRRDFPLAANLRTQMPID